MITREVIVCKLEDLPQDGMLQFEIDGKIILLHRAAHSVHAVEGICPHRGAQLVQGRLEGDVVVCPWHDWAFDLKNGCGLTNPTSSLKCYDVSVRNGDVVVVI